MPRAILLDCDPGHDDAIALLLALASPELELLGVTTVAGNQTLEKTTANALRVLDFLGRDDVADAAARVFTSGIDITMLGLDVTHRALFTPRHEEQLTGRTGELVRALLRFYGEFHRKQYGWDGSPIHDAVAVAHVARADLVETAK